MAEGLGLRVVVLVPTPNSYANETDYKTIRSYVSIIRHAGAFIAALVRYHRVLSGHKLGFLVYKKPACIFSYH